MERLEVPTNGGGTVCAPNARLRSISKRKPCLCAQCLGRKTPGDHVAKICGLPSAAEHALQLRSSETYGRTEAIALALIIHA